MYLGGPLTFMSELRNAFDDTLGVKGILPEDSLYYVAIGSALLAKKDEPVAIDSILDKVKNYRNNENFSYIEPLFKDEKEYEEFTKDHDKDRVETLPLEEYRGPLYLGVDSDRPRSRPFSSIRTATSATVTTSPTKETPSPL